MFVRAYLRASTTEQDASRARSALDAFAQSHGQHIASYYTENESGASLQRPELFRLLADAKPGDILLVEQVDRLSRLTEHDWQKLRATIKAKEVRVVALDLPTSHQFMASNSNTTADAFTSRMLGAINDMLLDMLAAVARKDYEDRRRRQNEGIAKAKAQGAYKGRGIDKDKHASILALLKKGTGIRETAKLLGVSTSTVLRARDKASTSA
ncbi:recombinase family protein [Stutzerimonas stutzeri]|uniref:recombinase family protein n=1 Tax=Stutzerimonas stutzeri TaxID=316 RepID=UPI000F7920D8|nr:recombinase family protein [Stutzerimonas stutzeri]MCQ4239946.1 recombinase family protein [Stutzerimonas stutzeri]RRV65099.1 serine recombinase [Stutzerimonas stutzeri]